MLAVVCLPAGALPALSAPPTVLPGPRPAGIPLRRVVLLHLPPPEAGQAKVQLWIAIARMQNVKHRRRQTKSVPDTPPDGGRRAGVPPSAGRARAPEEADPAQLRAVADTLLADD